MKSVIVFSLTICLVFVFSFACYAALDAGNIYPSYVPVSGGAFAEVESSLGRGCLILPVNYCEGSIGYSGSSYSLCNLLSSTINGYFYTDDGVQYVVRATRMNYFEFSTSSGYTTYYTDLGVSSIYNTNIQLIDLSGERENNPRDAHGYKVEFWLALIGVTSVLSFVTGRFFKKCS